MYERQLSIERQTYGDDHPRLATTLFQLAVVSSNLKDTNKARGYLMVAHAITVNTYGPDHPQAQEYLGHLRQLS